MKRKGQATALRLTRYPALGFLLCMFFVGPARAQRPSPDAVATALLDAYPASLAAVGQRELVWRDGTRMPLRTPDPDRPLDWLIRHGSIMDMFDTPYPRGPAAGAPDAGADPGRVRNVAFFTKMYGDCRRGEVSAHLVPVIWLPHTWGRKVSATSINGVADRLTEISAEIDTLDPEIKRAAYPLGGTYNCRGVADTGGPSMHAFGAAIDLNVSMSDYWLWERGAPYRNRIPMEIVEIFEHHGFIWGGKWSHYDTMHFEYRPELLNN